MTEKAILGFGCKIRRWDWKEHHAMIDSYPPPHRRVLKRITSHHPRRFPEAWAGTGTLLLFSSRHVLCVKNGVTLDWSINKALRIFDVWEITKGEKS